MQTKRQVFSGYTAQTNTPESDRVLRVLHHVVVSVTSEFGKQKETVELLARDPLDAMDRVRAMDDAAYGRLTRVPSR